jgi:hypothetical protein
MLQLSYLSPRPYRFLNSINPAGNIPFTITSLHLNVPIMSWLKAVLIFTKPHSCKNEPSM